MNAPTFFEQPDASTDLPRNLEAESSVLAALMADNESFLRISGVVDADDFYDPAHRAIFELIAGMIKEFRVADWITLKDAFKNHPSLSDVGGDRHILAIQQSSGSLASAHEYARVVRDLSARRKIIEAADEARRVALDTSADSDDWSTIAGRLKSDMDEVITKTADDEIKGYRDCLHELGKRIEDPPASIMTGIACLDHSFGGGMRRGCVYGIEGAMKRFKTGVLSAIYGGCWKNGTPSAFITLEMGPSDIIQRETAGFAGVNFRDFERLGNEQKSIDTLLRFENQHATAMDGAFFAHTPGITADKLMSIIARLVEVHGCEVVVLDYWQRVKGKKSSQSKAEFLEEVSSRIADYASLMGIIIVAASQLNRQDESLGSDGLARDCSWCATIHKEEIATSDPANPEAELWFDVTENRYGPSGTVGDENNRAFRIAPGPVLQEIRYDRH